MPKSFCSLQGELKSECAGYITRIQSLSNYSKLLKYFFVEQGKCPGSPFNSIAQSFIYIK